MAQNTPPSNTAANPASAAQLADLLENEQTRKQLIEQLRTQAPTVKDTSAASQSTASGSVTDDSLPRRVADSTQYFLTKLLDDMGDATAAIGAMARGENIGGPGMADWKTTLINFALVIAATVIAFIVLRLLAARIFAFINHWAGQAPPATVRRRLAGPATLRKIAAVIAALIVDVIAIALAGAVGYAVAMSVAGPNASVGTFDSLFVNAFVAVEIAKALVRTVFATRFARLRLFEMRDEVATYWNAWLCRLVGIAGYGMLVIVPVITALFTAALGNLAGLLIMLGMYVYAIRVVWRNRTLIRERLVLRASVASTAFFATLLRLLARVWHVLAIIYFTVLLVVSQVDPVEALPFMARATLQSVVAIALGLLVSAILTAILSHPIRLSDDMRTRLPLLEARINSYVPATLKGLRFITLVVVLLFVLDGWHAFDLSAWVMSESGKATISVVVHIAIILLFAALAWTIIASIIESRLSGTGTRAPSAREKTLLALFRNAALIVIVTMTILILLSQIGINIGPLIAGAGVVGLAIGFGAQKLVQDIITGIFIQLENGMNVNDVVEAGGVFGTVEKMTIRSVGIRTMDGGYHLIPFSSVDVVANHMRDFSYHMGEYTIAHRENVDDAIEHMRAAFAELMQDEVLSPEILEEITIPGVTAINERGVTIRVLIKTTPGMQWAIQRGYNRLLKKHFNAAGIELPYPHTVVYFGQDKDGNAPAAQVDLGRKADRSSPPKGRAPAAGHTPRPLSRAKSGSEDVLGNELEQRVPDEDDQV
ncbi:mechanosensitive ion channel domain-containing protein [Advenella kashmirensis]|uniref:mechanosensitive ion channel domain-containing protein n=1 Tax=Advenella kashmirensis TaxID=310575 RepID=UPI000406FEDE|nr:mechanosensitive ion channel domain-containing protein [Advenella kashmirensis]